MVSTLRWATLGLSNHFQGFGGTLISVYLATTSSIPTASRNKQFITKVSAIIIPIVFHHITTHTHIYIYPHHMHHFCLYVSKGCRRSPGGRGPLPPSISKHHLPTRSLRRSDLETQGAAETKKWISYIYICMHVCMHIYIYMYSYIYFTRSMYIHNHVCKCIYIYIF